MTRPFLYNRGGAKVLNSDVAKQYFGVVSNHEFCHGPWADFPQRRPDMVMNTSDLGSCRCLAGSPEQSFSPWVECCVVFGSARTLITGMVPPSVKEQVDIATAWARLHSTYIK